LTALLLAVVPVLAQDFQIPEIVEGKWNVAFVLIGPINDGGWSQAHYDGAKYVEENVENVHVVYVENIPEGTESEQVFRSLAAKGFNVIFGTSFDLWTQWTVAEDFPDSYFIHISAIRPTTPIW
jgi:basic membrane protein A